MLPRGNLLELYGEPRVYTLFLRSVSDTGDSLGAA